MLRHDAATPDAPYAPMISPLIYYVICHAAMLRLLDYDYFAFIILMPRRADYAAF